MTLSPSVYFGVWGTQVLAYLALLYQYRSKWNQVLTGLAEDIRSYNARNGYGQQVGRLDLAKAYAIPKKGENLKRFADANGVPVESYEQELNQHLGKPRPILWGFVFHVLATLYILAGLTYLTSGAFISPENFLLLGGGLLVVSIAAYLLG